MTVLTVRMHYTQNTYINFICDLPAGFSSSQIAQVLRENQMPPITRLNINNNIVEHSSENWGLPQAQCNTSSTLFDAQSKAHTSTSIGEEHVQHHNIQSSILGAPKTRYLDDQNDIRQMCDISMSRPLQNSESKQGPLGPLGLQTEAPCFPCINPGPPNNHKPFEEISAEHFQLRMSSPVYKQRREREPGKMDLIVPRCFKVIYQ